MKRTVFFLSAACLLLAACQPKKVPLWGRPSQPLSVWMAQSELQRHPDATTLDNMQGRYKWNYTSSIELLSLLDLYRSTGDSCYWHYVQQFVDSMIGPEGEIRTYKLANFNLDHICPGRLLFDFWEKTGDKKYRLAMNTLFGQLQQQPRTSDGGFWHKQVYPWQMWLDGLYMGEPFYARYTSCFVPSDQQQACYDDIVHQIVTVAKHTYDPASRLYRHGWDESREMFWADSITGQSAHCWGRGLGWYVMALCDVLDYLPQGAGRDSVADILKDILYVLPDYADHGTKMWYQVLDCPRRQGNYLESTGSIMFVYALLKCVRTGILSEKYTFLAKDWYRNFVKCFVRENPDGTLSITDCCAGAGLGGAARRSGKFDYYVNETQIIENDSKAIGPFIWASMMYEDLVREGK